MRKMSTAEKIRTKGGTVWRCRHCGYSSTSYAKTYANALKCVTKKYGKNVYNVVSAIFG